MPLAALARKAAKPKPAPKPARSSSGGGAARKPAAARTSSKKQKGGLAEQAFYETLRGELLQAFLKRWWSAGPSGTAYRGISASRPRRRRESSAEDPHPSADPGFATSVERRR